MQGVKKVDAGLAGVWVIDAQDYIFVRVGTYGDPQTEGSLFIKHNKLLMILY